MRIAFFGTAKFALPTLTLLQEMGYDITPVVTTPPRPQGRGRKITPSPIETLARARGLTVLTPENPNLPQFIDTLRQYSPDCGVLVAYGVILKEPLLKIPRLGFINLHPSLLPKYRGAAPIQRQLMDGCTESGVTVIAMDAGVDSGDILNQLSVSVSFDETAGELESKLAQLGAELVHKTLIQLEKGSSVRTPQNHHMATKAPKITPADRLIDWQRPTEEIHNRIRALSPEPGAVTSFRQTQLILLRSRILKTSKPDQPPGTILTELPGMVVATGNGLIEIIELKPAGKKILSGNDFRNGYRPKKGERLGNEG